MGLFRRGSHRRRDSSPGEAELSDSQPETTYTSTVLDTMPLPLAPSMDHLPQLVSDLQAVAPTAATSVTSANKAARILGKLFGLSEHESFLDNRVHMAQHTPLVPILMALIEAPIKKLSEHYYLTALLVLNNLCIPMQNKRPMVEQYGIVPTLCRRLVQDVSCHLIAIILVNLSICDLKLRLQLIAMDSGLIESLAYALRVACMKPAEYDHLGGDQGGTLPVQEQWQRLVAADHVLRQAMDGSTVEDDDPCDDSILEDDEDDDESDASMPLRLLSVPPTTHQVFPETVRWTLTALKNLSRPCKDPSIAQSLVSMGVVPLIMGFVAVEANMGRVQSEQTASTATSATTMASDNGKDTYEDACVKRREKILWRKTSILYSPTRTGTGTASVRSLKEVVLVCANSAGTWEAHSAQDTALMIIGNLAAMSFVREYLLTEVPTVQVLSAICNCDSECSELLVYQRVKARMGLAYLLASSGHYGQEETQGLLRHMLGKDYSILLMSDAEVMKLVTILSDTLHRRCGESLGYSAHNFSVKYVLSAIRCLLTQYDNQVRMSRTSASALNALLVKILALHSLQNVMYIDTEAAEHACFSLYLLSNHCFRRSKSATPFLPISLSHGATAGSYEPGMCNVCDLRVTKILTAYRQRPDVTPPGRHAAEQLLKRIKYLFFHGTAASLAKQMSSSQASDFDLDDLLGELVDMMTVTEIVPAGARPDANIFDRSLLRRCALRVGSETETLAWDNDDVVDLFETALQAAQDLSFGSSKVRHLDGIDDVLIANNIVHSAMGEKTESYNFMWSWEDKAQEIQRQLANDEPTDLLPLSCRVGPEEGLLPSLGILDKLFGALYQ